MATHDYIIANASGAAFRTDLNNALAAIVSNNSNSSSPATTYAYQWWADTSAGVLKIRNSANNAWIELLQLDGTLTLEDGAVGTPALAFRDDLDTGIYSAGDNKLNVATGGVDRLELGSETIFNNSGADVDFRIEGDTDANLFHLDASTDRVGISESAPAAKLHVGSGSDTEVGARITGGASGGTDIADFRTNNGTIRMKVNNDVTISTGNLVIGTSGKGIDFSAVGGPDSGSSANELLDDYEEGTFTPIYNTGSPSSAMFDSAVYRVTEGHYTKVGRLVSFSIRIECTSVTNSNSGSSVLIVGLPYTQASGNLEGGAFFTAAQAFDTSNSGRVPTIFVQNSAANLLFFNSDATALTVGASGNNFLQIAHIKGSYFAA